MGSLLSHDVRVLACGHCGAPNTVPVQGGWITCGYCQAGMEVALRQEESLARSPEEEIDRLHRLVALRAQDGRPLIPPPSVAPYLAAGAIAPRKREAALRAWRSALVELRARYASEPEERLYFLTVYLADYMWVRGEHLEFRALVESAVEVMRTRRYRQVSYCLLAGRAALFGDLAAAEDWLRPCDPTPYDLDMDTRYRFARAFMATIQGDYQEVLVQLGESPKDHPFADVSDLVVLMYRAHALERVRSVDAAATLLCRACREDPYTFQLLEDIRAGAPVELVMASLDEAKQRLAVLDRHPEIGALGCLPVFLVAEGLLISNYLWWQEDWFKSATAMWLIPLLLSPICVPLVFRAWRVIQALQRRAETRRALGGKRT